jgi:hypothetical protein
MVYFPLLLYLHSNMLIICEFFSLLISSNFFYKYHPRNFAASVGVCIMVTNLVNLCHRPDLLESPSNINLLDF